MQVPRPENRSIRCYRLVIDSLTLAIMLEVTLLEGDLVHVLLSKGLFRLALLAKVVCLTIILAPLIVYLALNSWKGAAAAPGKITAIAVIVGLNLMANAIALVHALERG